MKKLLIILISWLIVQQLYGQKTVYIGPENMRIGVTVGSDGEELSIDSLSDGYDKDLMTIENMVVPPGTPVRFSLDSVKASGVAFVKNGNHLNVFKKPYKKSHGVSTSSSPGNEIKYIIFNTVSKDTISFNYKVGYYKMELIDLLPADRIDVFLKSMMEDFFSYPDSSRFNWIEKSYVDSVDTKGIPINPTFPHDENSLLFVPTSWIDKECLIQLEGFHNEPVNFDEDNPFSSLLFRDLPPGDYVLNIWPHPDAEEELKLKYSFKIAKPWYLQNSGIGIISSIIGFLIGIIGVVVSRIRSKRKEKELLYRQKISEAELKAIRAQLNPHFLFNALNSIQNLVTQEKNEEAITYTGQLSKLMRGVLSGSDSQFHELGEELRLTELYLSLEKLRFNFDYSIDLKDESLRDVLVPVMLLQPFVENSIKHGIPGVKNGNIKILIHRENEFLTTEIIDNGVGLSSGNSSSSGIQLSNDRIRFLNDLYENKASISINNRKDENGVIVLIKLPLE